MINDNIFNIVCFSTFPFAYYLGPVFSVIFFEICLNSGFVKYQKEKVEKQKMLKMLSFIICEAPPKNSTIFKSFLAIFTLFHLKNWQLCKIFPSYICGTPQVMFGLVNNHGKWCQMSCVIFHDWTFLVGMCDHIIVRNI